MANSFDLGTLSAKLSVIFQDFLNGLRTAPERTLTVPVRADATPAMQTLQATSAQARLEAFQATLTTTLPERARLSQDLAQLPTLAIDIAPLERAEQVLQQLPADLAQGGAHVGLQGGMQLGHDVGELGVDPGQHLVDEGAVTRLPPGSQEIELRPLDAAADGGVGDEL
jgi:hypothetical protein